MSFTNKNVYKCFTEEWLFARRFTYTGKKVNYYYATGLFEKRKKHEPKKRERVPYLFVDDDGMMINLTNEHGKWENILWNEIKKVTIYYTTHPWDALGLDYENFTHEKNKTIQYLKDMEKKYPTFKEEFFSIYNSKFSFYLECKKKNVQIQIPPSRIEGEEVHLLKETFSYYTGKEIEKPEEPFWQIFFE